MPVTTLNMSLTTWPSATDLFDHTALASNFSKIDSHDHSSGKGVQVPTGGLADTAVTAAKLADNAVTNAKVADNAIGTAELIDTGVTGDKLSSTVANQASVNTTGVNRRAYSYVATEEAITGSTFVHAATTDSITITTTTRALVELRFEMLWRQYFTVDPRQSDVTGQVEILMNGGSTPGNSLSATLSVDPSGYQTPLGLPIYSDYRTAQVSNNTLTSSNSSFSGQNAALPVPRQVPSTGYVMELAAGAYTFDVKYCVPLIIGTNEPTLLVSERTLRARVISYG